MAVCDRSACPPRPPRSCRIQLPVCVRSMMHMHALFPFQGLGLFVLVQVIGDADGDIDMQVSNQAGAAAGSCIPASPRCSESECA